MSSSFGQSSASISPSFSISYNLMQAATDKIFIESGITVKRPTFNVEVSALTPEQRQILVAWKKAFPFTFDLKTIAVGQLPSFMNGVDAPREAITSSIAIAYDHVLSTDEVFVELDRMIREQEAATCAVAEMNVGYEDRVAAHRADQNAKAEARKIAERKAAEQREAEAEAKRIARATIEWREDGTAIVNLRRAIIAASRLDWDSRFGGWVKCVTAVDVSKPNGYCFEGEWINDGTQLIARGEKAVYLVKSEQGSRRNQTGYYSVVAMDEQGILYDAEIDTNDRDSGWALKIREQVADLLK